MFFVIVFGIKFAPKIKFSRRLSIAAHGSRRTPLNLAAACLSLEGVGRFPNLLSPASSRPCIRQLESRRSESAIPNAPTLLSIGRRSMEGFWLSFQFFDCGLFKRIPF